MATAVATADIAAALSGSDTRYHFESGDYSLSGNAVVIQARQHVTADPGTRITWAGTGDVAFYFGDPANQASFYGASLGGFDLISGCIAVRSMAQNCVLERIRSYIAPATTPAIRFDGQTAAYGTGGYIGEQMQVEDVHVIQALGDGLRADVFSALNGMEFSACSITQCVGHGVVLGTTAANGDAEFRMRKCVVQGNGTGALGGAQILLAGLVDVVIDDDCHFESRGNCAPTILRMVGRNFSGTTRRPRLTIRGGTKLVGNVTAGTKAIELVEHGRCLLDETVRLITGLVQWYTPVGTSQSASICPVPTGTLLNTQRSFLSKSQLSGYATHAAMSEALDVQLAGQDFH